MTTAHHGFDLPGIREALDGEDWEDDHDNPGGQSRSVYLGSVFSLTPSGKFYMPFACSNVAGCDTCGGTGHVTTRRLKRRTIKKHQARHASTMRRFDRLFAKGGGTPSLGKAYRPEGHGAAYAFIDRQPKKYRMRYLTSGATCTACNGCGSREAYLDELWREEAESALNSIGCSLQNGEGDPCDLFATEYRDAPEDEENDDAGEEVHS